ncbi:MAG: hypothetical protein MZW92_38960 [Comamonadaceae bacterium]|nr:hypothetical protein [Comamonadaceae bacterium]
MPLRAPGGATAASDVRGRAASLRRCSTPASSTTTAGRSTPRLDRGDRAAAAGAVRQRCARAGIEPGGARARRAVRLTHGRRGPARGDAGAALRARDRAPRPRLLRARRADDAGRRVRPAVPRAAGTRGRAPGAASRPTRRRSAWAARRARDLPEVRHAVPMLSIRTETRLGDARRRAFDARVRARAAARPRRSPPVEYAAELKFDGLAVSLRYERGVLVLRRHARRRRRSART